MPTQTEMPVRRSRLLTCAGLLLAGAVSFGSLTLVQTDRAHAGQSGLLSGFIANNGYVPRYNPSYTRRPSCNVKRHHLPRLNSWCNSQQPGSYFSVATCRCETLN